MASLQELMVDEVEVALLRVTAAKILRVRCCMGEQLGRDVHIPRNEGVRRGVVVRWVIPEVRLTHTVALAWSARELEGGVHDIRREAKALMQACNEESVAVREEGNRQDADGEATIVAPEEAFVCEGSAWWGDRHASSCQAAGADLIL
jgi:hypothetical protein